MSMEAASIAQHCQTLRLAAIDAQFASLADQLTDQAHIIETGSESYRFHRTLRKKRKE